MDNIRNLNENKDRRIRLRRAAWDDRTFPSSRIRQGATQKPDYDTTDLCLLFPQNDADEIAYINEQMRHNWEYGTPIRPHIHWLQESATLPVWKIDYRFANNGEDFGPWTNGVEVANEKYVYTGGTLVQISEFPEIDLSAYATSSCLFDFKLYRDDNVLSGDAKMKSFDFHYQIDGFGSTYEYTK